MARSRNLPLISIIIPTIDGRERWCENALSTFMLRTDVRVEPIIVKNKPTCGIAWNEGIQVATGDYILLAADDIEPATDTWWLAGIYWAKKGYLPCARILNADGTLQSCGDWIEEMDTGTHCEFARIPFGTREQVQAAYPIIETHYATDYWFSEMGRRNGWETVVVREFCFYHHFANVGRLDERLNADMKIFWRRAGRPGVPRPG